MQFSHLNAKTNDPKCSNLVQEITLEYPTSTIALGSKVKGQG